MMTNPLSLGLVEWALNGAGNAWTDANEDNRGAIDFWYYHALISDTTRDGLLKTCNFSSIGPLQASLEATTDGKVRPQLLCIHPSPNEIDRGQGCDISTLCEFRCNSFFII